MREPRSRLQSDSQRTEVEPEPTHRGAIVDWLVNDVLTHRIAQPGPVATGTNRSDGFPRSRRGERAHLLRTVSPPDMASANSADGCTTPMAAGAPFTHSGTTAHEPDGPYRNAHNNTASSGLTTCGNLGTHAGSAHFA